MAARFDRFDTAVVFALALVAGVVLAVGFAATAIAREVTKPPETGPFALDPGILTFGLQRPGVAGVRRAGLTSHAPGEVVVSSVAVSGTGFSIAWSPTLPLTLRPGERVEFDVSFQSNSPCTCSGTLKVHVNTAPGTLFLKMKAGVE